MILADKRRLKIKNLLDLPNLREQTFRVVCHLDEGEITLETPQAKSPIFAELLTEIPRSSG